MSEGQGHKLRHRSHLAPVCRQIRHCKRRANPALCYGRETRGSNLQHFGGSVRGWEHAIGLKGLCKPERGKALAGAARHNQPTACFAVLNEMLRRSRDSSFLVRSWLSWFWSSASAVYSVENLAPSISINRLKAVKANLDRMTHQMALADWFTGSMSNYP